MNAAEFRRIFSLPFGEASDFFRDKLTIESSFWDELSGAAHAKAFTSAGAYHAELLAELRRMTDKAIAGGMDIREFREKFRPLVERYGWQLKGGGAAWRSDLIWRTNITTAYQAGRWRQFEAGNIGYLTYLHLDGQANPRLNHMALDNLTLPIHDPFWTINYPPNGFRCHCRAVAATEAEYNALPSELKTRPGDWATKPDNGWDYNVGQSGGTARGYRALTDKMESLPNDIARAWMARFLREPAFERFVNKKISGDFPVAVLSSARMADLGAQSQTVWLAAESLRAGMGVEEYRRVSGVMDNGKVSGSGRERRFEMEVEGRVFNASLRLGAGANMLLSLTLVN
jgi:hypothetical protein